MTEFDIPLMREHQPVLASYAKRLMAFMIDALLLGMAITFYMEHLGITPIESQDMNAIVTDMLAKMAALDNAQRMQLALFPYLMFFILHGFLLFYSGQTIGKRVLGIAIVTLDNQRPSFVLLILNRYVSQWLMGLVPGIGIMLRSIDVTLIFYKDKRCGHDWLAKTKVIDLRLSAAVVDVTQQGRLIV